MTMKRIKNVRYISKSAHIGHIDHTLRSSLLVRFNPSLF